MAATLRGYLGVLGVGVYALSGLFALGLAVNFGWSLIKRDLSPWWFWPLGVLAVLVLMIIAGNLLRLTDKDD
jgi:ABC-type branched-subunit amino acid transport system permease subunit